jgi:hypothetical protein
MYSPDSLKTREISSNGPGPTCVDSDWAMYQKKGAEDNASTREFITSFARPDNPIKHYD